ncbi:hypothetical protein [Streptomyces sp. NPDC047718]|uniref:hypothetical protein n=1 Tax=Streptomyces sp. NPDC047718 TaxID=3155479 RepID=UPI0033E4C453
MHDRLAQSAAALPHTFEGVLVAAVPEFVGGLGVALVVALAAWAWRHLTRDSEDDGQGQL